MSNLFVLFVIGTFKLTIEFTEEYPNKPPTVRFVSKMFHPNGKCTIYTNIANVHIITDVFMFCNFRTKLFAIRSCSDENL